MIVTITLQGAKRAMLLFAFGIVCAQAYSQQTDASAHLTVTDSTLATVADSTTVKAKRGIGQRLLNYFRESNKPKPNKKVDFGVLPGPHYSATTGLGMGIIGTATYTTDLEDATLMRSNASVYADMTTGGYFTVGLRGTHICPHEKYRLDYKLKASTFSTQFWGIGYDAADNDDNETDYRLNHLNAMARFMFKLAPNTFIGPVANYRFYQARGVDEDFAHLWEGQDKTLNVYTLGVSFTYDSRDFMLNAKKGVFIQFDQTFSPRFLGNGNHSFSTSEVTFATYGRLWKGAVLAGDVHGLFNYGKTPWALLSPVGSNDRMRGYYEGRYRDQNLMEAQVELRQHIKGRHGVVGWVGLANAFHNFDELTCKKNLYNAGVGYRWEFKKGINIRIDYGFTRNGGGFIFNINEAF